MRNGFRRASSFALLFSVFLLAFAGFRANAAGKGQAPEAIPGEFVVKFKTQPGQVRTMDFAQAQKGRVLRNLRRLGVKAVNLLQTDDRFAVVKMENSRVQASAAVVSALSANREIEYAEPNYVYKAIGTVPDGFTIARAVKEAGRNLGAVRTQSDDDWFGGWNPGWGWGNPVGGQDPIAQPDPGFGGDRGTAPRMPNDAAFSLLWGMNNTGQADSTGQTGTAGVDIGGPAAWGYGVGSRQVVVAIIDTGIDYNHEDLAQNMWTNSAETAGNGVDDDNNGYVDDVRGWNFSEHNNDPMDDNRHGTHCAGTIGALGNNGVGVAGVNWEVTMMPLKFLSASGSGSLAGALEAIKYATKMRVHVMSNSWGGGGYSQALFDAITEARDQGILFVAAAGNESNNNDTRPTYPATYQVDNVLTVAAIDSKERTASWSNYGRNTVHLAAPGVRIYSTTPNNTYESLSGTSMACPHVAGAAALLWSLNGSMTYADIKQRLVSTVEPARSLETKTVSGGRLSIVNAITNRVPERRTGPQESEWLSSAYTLESPHDYVENSNQIFSIRVPGARFVRVHFSRVSMEDGYDYLHVVDSANQDIESLTGESRDTVSTYVEGDSIFLRLQSDDTVNTWGFAVDRVDYIL